MSKKLLNKVISAVLVLAICSTAFLGGVVSAATNLDVKVEVANKGYDTIAKDEIVTTTVTITSSDPFVAGVFKVVTSGLELSAANVKSVEDSEGKIDTIPFIDSKIAPSEGKVLFQGWEDKDLSALTSYVKVVVEISLKSTAAMAEGETASITVSEVDVTDINESVYEVTEDSITAGGIHVHKYEEVDEDNDASVKTSVCTCGEKKYQLVENESNLSGITEKNDHASQENGGYAVHFGEEGKLNILYATKGQVSAEGNEIYLAYVDDEDNITKIIASDGATEEGANDKGYLTEYEGGVKTIGDTVKAVFVEVDADGKVVSKSDIFEKSIAEYCFAKIADENEDDKVKNYCRAMIDYASAAQEYLKYNEDTLINDGEYAEYADMTAEDNDKFKRSEEPTNWKFNGGNITLTNRPVIRLYLSAVGDTDVIDTLTFNVNYYGKNVEYKGENLKTVQIGGKEYYYIDIADMPAKCMSDVIKITTDDGDFGEYSVDTYAYDMRNTTAAKVTKILVAYSNALATAYPNTTPNA